MTATANGAAWLSSSANAMSDLTIAAYAMGAVLAVIHLPAIGWPAAFRRALEAFPRNVGAARALTAVDLFWVSWVIYHANLGRFDSLRPGLFLAAPAAYLLLVFYLDELLAPRALGGLLLLVANPVLEAARWNESPWRLLLTVLCYVWVVFGMMFVLSPYRFRQVAAVWIASENRCRLMGAIGLAFGALLIVLGRIAY